jgi:hypothetical protein
MSDFASCAWRPPAAKALRMALGSDPPRAQVFKVPHHASKHGVNLELVELIKPRLTLISSAAGGGKYNFPHTVAQESVREALEAIASTGAPHRPDHELGIHYTSASDSDARPLGSLAVVISPTGRKRRLWRFGDASMGGSTSVPPDSSSQRPMDPGLRAAGDRSGQRWLAAAAGHGHARQAASVDRARARRPGD